MNIFKIGITVETYNIIAFTIPERLKSHFIRINTPYTYAVLCFGNWRLFTLRQILEKTHEPQTRLQLDMSCLAQWSSLTSLRLSHSIKWHFKPQSCVKAVGGAYVNFRTKDWDIFKKSVIAFSAITFEHSAQFKKLELFYKVFFMSN